MTNKKTIYIWDGGVFSPPTRAVGKLAFNISSYISSKFDNKVNVEYHFVPTNKYYNKPWVRCVDEEDRVYMLHNLVKYIHANYSVPSNIKFVVNEQDIHFGKKEKDPGTTMKSLEYFTSKQKENVYLANSIENMIQIVKGGRHDSLKLLFMVKSICYDIYSAELIGVNQADNYVYKSIQLRDLLKDADGDYPKEVSHYFKSNKITKSMVEEYISSNKEESIFERVKKLIMERITFLPKHLVPEAYRAAAGNRVREELDVYYSSLKNIQNFTTPGIEKYITDKGLYEHCKSRYVDKLISRKSKKSKSRTGSRSESRSEPKSKHTITTSKSKSKRKTKANSKIKSKSKTIRKRKK